MKNTTKLFAAAALLAALSYAATTKLLVDSAFDKQPPKALGLLRGPIRGSKKSTPYKDAVEAAKQELLSRESETVETTAEDGTKLRAHLVRCGAPKRVIIAMHGWRSSYGKDFGLISRFLHDSGCDVLYVEQRAQNGSDGSAIGMGMLERHDCISWINRVAELCGDKLPVYLYGISMGASSVLMAGELELPKIVHGIIADSAFTSPKEQFRHILRDNLHMEYKLRMNAADRLAEKKLGMKTDEASTVNGLRAVMLPVLLIHGTDDTFVPIDMFYENLKAAKGNCMYLVIPGAGHCMGYYIEKKTYEDALLNFWEMCD